MDNQAFLWTPESSAHPMHSQEALLPSAVPSFTHVPHRPIELVGVTAFTRRGERPCFVAEQWTGVWRSCGQRAAACGPPVDNVEHSLWTDSASTGCGARLTTNPQGTDLAGRPADRCGCGPDLDNFLVPRLWKQDCPHICGERLDGHPKSNTSGVGERSGNGRGRSRTGPGAPSGAVAACSSAVLDAVGELGDLVVDGPPLRHQCADLPVRVHHRRMVTAAELRADLR